MLELESSFLCLLRKKLLATLDKALWLRVNQLEPIREVTQPGGGQT